MSERDNDHNHWLLWLVLFFLWAKSCGPDPNDWKVRDLQRRVAELEQRR